MFLWEVTGNYRGRVVKDEVKASTQSEARQRFNRIYPEYTPGAARNVGRA